MRGRGRGRWGPAHNALRTAPAVLRTPLHDAELGPAVPQLSPHAPRELQHNVPGGKAVWRPQRQPRGPGGRNV